MKRKKRILVIEDAYSLRRDIVEMLRFEEFEVVDAENGLVGVQRTQEFKPDLIICDIMMPVMNGYDVLRALQGDPKTATIPFIFLTARADRQDQRIGMQSGADDYVTKPFTATELLETVKARLAKAEIGTVITEGIIDGIRERIITALPHELRTPLNVIMGFSNLMMMDAEGLDTKRVQEMSQYINGAANRLYRLIENYIMYAYTEIVLSDTNPESKRREVFKTGVMYYPMSAIEGYVRERAQSVQPPREDDLVFDLKDVDALPIYDEYLKRIVEELIDNACKFSAPPTTPPHAKIYVSTYIEDGFFVISVKDQGRGIDPEKIDQIGAYNQFERHLYEQQGSGLGLIITKRLTELHGGVLDIDSTLGGGTTVRVALPLQRATEMPVGGQQGSAYIH